MDLADLLPASFRGVPFGVLRSEDAFGRRIALKQYPGRNQPWAQDMGRAARRFRFTAFLLEGDLIYGGGPIDIQRALVAAAAEADGPGILTHPTYGIVNVACESASLGSDITAATFAEVEFSFVEFGQQIFASLATSTVDAVEAAVGAAGAAISIASAAVVLSALSSDPSGHDVLASSVASWSQAVIQAGADATAALSLTSQLPGPYGRYSAGANTGFAGSAYAPATTVDDLIDVASSERALIAAAGTGLSDAVSDLNAGSSTTDVAAAIQALVSALVGACANPADAVRLLQALQSSPVLATGAVGEAVADLFRRQIALALATASAAYQPSSYDDALQLMGKVTGALDAEIDVAGDQGDDAAFSALRDVRRRVVADLTTRGATLARMRTFNIAASVPDIVLAQRLYRDPSRADQLTRQVGERHPLFMPSTFQALAA